MVDEIDLDDEWIAEKEDPLFSRDLCWFKDNELFNVDAIRIVLSQDKETQASLVAFNEFIMLIILCLNLLPCQTKK